MDIPIIYEDEQLLVINKPPGIVVNRAESVKGETIQDWAQNQKKILLERAGIVHRIDKETSGILLLAKTQPTLEDLQQQFAQKLIKKVYLALVHGKVEPSEGEIRVPVGRLPWNREQFGVVPGGKEAVTRYKSIKSFSTQAESFTLLEVYPETGRTHQIRVHFKYLQHPLVGDYLYAGRKTSRHDRQWAGRVMLHAWKINFRHPVTGETLALEAPIPDDMNRIEFLCQPTRS